MTASLCISSKTSCRGHEWSRNVEWYGNTYRRRLDLVRLRDADAGPHDEVRVLARRGRLLVAADALLEGQARLVVLHDVVRADRAAVDVRGPEVGLERLVVRVAALGGLPRRAHEHVLHLRRVLALGREQEARAEHDAVRAHREQRRDLRARRDTACSND